MLGNQIRQYLEQNGVELSHAAQALDIPLDELDEILHETKRISAEDYYGICRFLGVELDYFFHQPG